MNRNNSTVGIAAASKYGINTTFSDRIANDNTISYNKIIIKNKSSLKPLKFVKPFSIPSV